MKEEFIENLKDVLGIDERELGMNDVFREYPEWDSLAYLSLIAMLDDEYGCQIEEQDFSKLITVEDLYNRINNK